jgi:hypothetical protein
MFVRRTD